MKPRWTLTIKIEAETLEDAQAALANVSREQLANLGRRPKMFAVGPWNWMLKLVRPHYPKE